MEKITNERAIEFILGSIDLLRNFEGKHFERYYLCTMSRHYTYNETESEGWAELIEKYYHVAEKKFKGEYWNLNENYMALGVNMDFMGSLPWWQVNTANNQGKIKEVYALKIKFLEDILEDIQK